MKQAIKILEARIEKLNQEMEKTEKIIDEPEMLSDYHFAMADMANFEMEIIELTEAIKILNEKI